MYGATKDITLDELRLDLARPRLTVSNATLHRFFGRRGITRKNTAHALEHDRPDVLEQRREWFEGQSNLDPERLVFIDDTWTATNITRSHGRCTKGERLRMG